MKLWHRILLVGLVATVPLVVISAILIRTAYSGRIRFCEQERRGLAFLGPVEQLVDLLPRHEATARQAAAGEASARVADERKAIDQALERLAADYHGPLGRGLQFTDAELIARGLDQARLSGLLSQWVKLRTAPVAVVAQGQGVGQMVSALRAMIQHCSHTSNLLLDDCLDSFFLMQVSVVTVPEAQQQLAEMVFQIGQGLQGGPPGSNRLQIAMLAVAFRRDALDRVVADARTSLAEDQSSYGASPSLQTNLPAAVQAFSRASETFLRLADRVAAGETVPAPELEAAGWEARAECHRLWRIGTQELDRLIAMRIGHIRAERGRLYLVLGLTLGLSLLLMGVIIRNLLRIYNAEVLEANEQLRSQEARLRAIGDNLPDGVVFEWLRDEAGALQVGYVSAGIERVNGLSVAAVLEDATRWLDQVLPEDRALLAGATRATSAANQPFDVVVRMLVGAGRLRWMRFSATPQALPGGGLVWRGMAQDVSERVEALTAARQSETRFRTLVDRAPTAVGIGRDGISLYVNQAYLEMFGCQTLGEVVGRSLGEQWAPECRTLIEERAHQRTRGLPVPANYEAVGLRKDGTRFPVQIAATLVDLPDGPATLGFLTDITERRHAEVRIQYLNRTYAVLSEINQMIVREKHPQTLFEQACRIAVERGQFRMAWIGMLGPVGRRIRPVAWAGVVEGYLDGIEIDLDEPALAAGPAGQCFHSGQHAFCNDLEQDPAYIPWRDAAVLRGYRSSAGFPLRLDGQVVGLISFYSGERNFFNAEESALLDELAADLSFALEVNRREVEAQRAEQQFASAFEHAAVGMALVSCEGRWLRVNHALCRMLGYTAAELGVKTSQEITHPADLATDLGHMRRLLAGEIETYQAERRYFHKTGCLVWISLSVSLVRDAQKQPVHFIAQIQDITERRQAQEAQLRLITALEQAAESIVITDLEAAIVYANAAFERATGYSRQEALGQNPRLLKSGRHDAAFYADLWKTLQRGEVWRGHFINRRKDGTVYEEEATISPVRDGGGKVVNYMAIKLDVTRELELERQFRQAQRLDAIGRLAGGVAHDFNNILAAIMMQAELSAQTTNLSAEVRESLAQICSFAERGASLTRQLLLFSRQQVMQPRNLELNAAVSNIARMLQRIVGENYALAVQLHPDPLPVHADPIMVDQVLVNLVVNARDAMPGGGRVLLETARRTFAPNEVAGIPPATPGPHVGVRVSDVGCGIAAEILPRIFDPFFTTKEPGKGTGLGLATVFGIVKQHGGTILVDSEVGRGTTFHVFLPALNAAGVPGKTQVVAESRRGTEAILLVEDEPDLRALTRMVLERAGYRVIVAANGAEALRLWEQAGDGVSLLLTDLVLPAGISGAELATRLQARRPGLRVVFVSGYSVEVAGRPLLPQPGQAFLPKPFSGAELLQMVRRCLDS